MLALLAALLLSTARAATPEAGVQEDASIAIETPAKVVRHFDGSLRIGYADPLDLGQGSSFMESLAARLEESLRGAGKGGADVSVTLHKYAPFDLQTAVVSHEVDLFLVTSGYYIYLSDMGAGVEWISTLKPPQATDPERAAGSVFVVRADDTRYNQVSDLRTAFVAAAGMASFDGWITALDEVANVSQYPKNFFGKTTFLGASGLSVARAVLERDADVGILRVCELETLTAAGLVEPGSLRVVGEKPQQGLACVSSTELFPGLALAAQTYVPEDVRRRIAAAVYSMPVPESGLPLDARQRLQERAPRRGEVRLCAHEQGVRRQVLGGRGALQVRARPRISHPRRLDALQRVGEQDRRAPHEGARQGDRREGRT